MFLPGATSNGTPVRTMIDKLFTKLRTNNLIDWGVVFLGVVGVPGLAERLRPSFVKDFANDQLEKISIEDPLLDIVVDLATDSDRTSIELREALEKMCEVESIDMSRARRRWRAVSLEGILSDLDPNPVYGLIKLSEFWAAWGWPDDCPTSMRSNNEISPQDYYLQSNYEHVIADHRSWIAKEFVRQTTD
jgi:hypothetical protein